jgi:hypothetical protein
VHISISQLVATCLLGQCAPVGVAVLLDVGDEAHVLLLRPRAPVQPHLGAARRSSSPHTQVPNHSLFALPVSSLRVHFQTLLSRGWLGMTNEVEH